MVQESKLVEMTRMVDPSAGVTRRRVLTAGLNAAAGAIVTTGSAMAQARDPGQLAEARALLAEGLTIDMHSHAGLPSDASVPLAPLAQSMREGGMKAIALGFSSANRFAFINAAVVLPPGKMSIT